jgi:trans-aconitate 2-methyltransferase
LDSWNPQQYHRYGDERQRPAADLLAPIPLDAPAVVYDLGCGSGLSTALLARRWPQARITGVDSSPAMLAAARKALPGLTFAEADISGWSAPEPADLLFSNATLQWLGDHPRLFPRLMTQVKPGGVLAVQMPRNHGEPSHQAMLAAAEAGPWRERLRPLLRPSPVAPPAAYHALLRPLAARLDIWETIYLHELSGENPVAEWTKGTALKPLLDALDGEQRRGFEADYRARVAEAYPPTATGQTLFPFRRLFLIAERGRDE